jgi:hypothetical protein
MKVYLDQNKWIQLARVINGVENDDEIAKIPKLISDGVMTFPLSAIHYLETARITQSERRAKLGKVMWKASKGETIAASRNLIILDIELYLKQIFPQIIVEPLDIFSKGICHAFGMEIMTKYPPVMEQLLVKHLITGEPLAGVAAPIHLDKAQKEVFRKHLLDLKDIKANV